MELPCVSLHITLPQKVNQDALWSVGALALGEKLGEYQKGSVYIFMRMLPQSI